MRRALAGLALLLLACSCASRAPRGIPPELLPRGEPDAGPLEMPPLREERLDNGLTVLVLEDRELPVASIALFFPAGDAWDPPGLGGATTLMAGLLRQGTASRSAEAIALAIESVGGELTAASDLEWTSVQARVLSRDVELALDLVADVAQRPTFPEEELADLRRQTIGNVRSALDDPDSLAARFGTAMVHGARSPYAVDLTERSLSAIRRSDVVAQARRVLAPDGAILAVTGDVDGAAVLARVRALFGGWRGTRAEPPAFPDAIGGRRRIVLVDKPGLTQAFVRIGLPAFPRRHPDHPAAVLANAVLGGAYSSRLIKVLRAEGGKTYGVHSWFAARREGGAFWVSTSTRTPETRATLELVLAELTRFAEGGVTANELAHAKSNRVGGYARRFETGADVTGELVTARLMGVPLEEVVGWRARLAATPHEAVNAAARRWIDVERAQVVIVADAAKVRGSLEGAFGPIETVDFRDDPVEVAERRESE